MKNRKVAIIISVICGLLGTFLFCFAGYIISAAIYLSDNDLMSFFDGLMYVLSDPFSNYFNQYTIISMVLGFLIFETIFFLVLFFGSSSDSSSIDDDSFDMTDNKTTLESSSDFKSDDDLFDGLLSSSSNNLSDDLSGDIIDNDPSFKEPIMNALFCNGYELDQILAMIPIKDKKPDISAEELMVLFKKSLSAEQIKSKMDTFWNVL